MEASRQLRPVAEPQGNRQKPEQAPAQVIVIRQGGWRKDAKWITGLLLVFLLLPTLVTATLFRLTAEEPATKMIAAGLQGFFNYDELTAEQLPAMQANARQKPGVAVVPDLPVPVTIPSSEVLKLNAEDLQDRVLRLSASTIYRQGGRLDTDGKLAEQAAGGLMGGAATVPLEMLPLLEQMPKGSTGTPIGAGAAAGETGEAPTDLAKTFDEVDRLIISILSAQTHQLMGSLLRVLAAGCLVIGGLFVLFSRRWGRLANSGGVLVYAAFPGVLLLPALQLLIDPANKAPTQVFLSELETALRSVAGGVFLLGFTLSITATLGGAVSFVLRRRSRAKQPGNSRPTLAASE